MTEAVWATVVVAITGSITQAMLTRTVVKAERARMLEQITHESRVRRFEGRAERLQEAMADVLAAADPQIAPDYGQAVRLVLRIQLLLDRNDKAEAQLNGALNELAQRLEEYVVPGADRNRAAQALLHAHGQALDSANAVLRKHLPELLPRPVVG